VLTGDYYSVPVLHKVTTFFAGEIPPIASDYPPPTQTIFTRNSDPPILSALNRKQVGGIAIGRDCAKE